MNLRELTKQLKDENHGAGSLVEAWILKHKMTPFKDAGKDGRWFWTTFKDWDAEWFPQEVQGVFYPTREAAIHAMEVALIGYHLIANKRSES